MQETNENTITKDVLVEAAKEQEAAKIKVTENTTIVQLPSNGLINPNIKEVTLRRMTTKEAKTLLTSNDPNYLTTLLVGCIVDPVGITTKDLHPNDIIYLLFILRYISSPKSIRQMVYCKTRGCKKSFETDVNVQALQVSYATPESYDFTVTLPDAGDKIKFKILSEFDITNSEKISQRKIKQQNIEEDDWFTYISKEACMLVSKNDEDFEDFDSKVKYLEGLSMYDFDTFNQAYIDITSSFGLNRKFMVECPKCKEDIEVEAYIAPDFFRLV